MMPVVCLRFQKIMLSMNACRAVLEINFSGMMNPRTNQIYPEQYFLENLF